MPDTGHALDPLLFPRPEGVINVDIHVLLEQHTSLRRPHQTGKNTEHDRAQVLWHNSHKANFISVNLLTPAKLEGALN